MEVIDKCIEVLIITSLIINVLGCDAGVSEEIFSCFKPHSR